MRVLELVINPVGTLGWSSEKLEFGNDITQLYGPNGCGKTPVIHSITYAMGYPVRYREDILEHCESVRLKANHNGKDITFERKFVSSFHVECCFSGSDDPVIFYNEKDLSNFLIEIFDLSITALTSTSSEPTTPYVSTFLPLFYMDQDSGYNSVYKAPNNFIKDQYAEMVRLALGVPAKHSYENKKLLIDKKRKLDALNIAIVNNEKFIEQLVEQAGDFDQNSSHIYSKLEEYKSQLDELRSNQDAASDADSVMSYMINEKLSEQRDLSLSIRNLENRVSDFNKIKSEIEIEINTLSLNEESRRIFSSFNDICSSPGCELFLNSSESYGKNLLYLRDQIKDLDRNTKYQEIRLEELKRRYKSLSKEINSLKTSIEGENKESSAQGLVNTISEITKRIIDLQSDKEIYDRIEEEKHAYVELLNDRERLQNDIASMDGDHGNADLRVLEFRTVYKAKIIEWLNILSTKNVSRDISVDSDFNVLFGNERLTQFSGSTLLRAVLALKAAFFEIYLMKEAPAIEFLIFDTPRQHDIESEHFAAFIWRLKKLVENRSAQVIFSTTEYHYETQINDKEWVPSFPGEEQNMFLGVVD